MIVSSYSEITENEYLDPRTAQVAIVDHVKQVIVVVLHYGVPCSVNLIQAYISFL